MTTRAETEADLSPGTVEWVTAFADDEHLLGARHAAWIGLGPFLEEDLAFCSIAQDELGHAIALYEFVTDDVDHFGLLRPAADYRSCWLAELPCDSWDLALVRHWLYDQAEVLRWQALNQSTVSGLAALSARAEREEEFHRTHAEMFLSRVTGSDSPGQAKIQAAVEALLPVAVGLWDPVVGEADAMAEGVVSATSEELGAQWRNRIEADLERWGIDISWPTGGPAQQHRCERSADFAAFHSYLQEVVVVDPSATW